jgi:hypothetical protein
MDDQTPRKNTNPGIIFSGVIYSSSPDDPSSSVGVGGVIIEIKPEESGLISKTIVSGLGGGFDSGLIFPGKYKLYFSDPKQNYYRPPLPIALSQDLEYPIYVYPAGQRGKGRRRATGAGINTSAASGIVINKKKERLKGMVIKIKSVKIEEKKNNFLKKLLTSRSREEKKPREVSVEIKTDALGMFFCNKNLPRGTYNVYCVDPSGKYSFSTIFMVLKSQRYPPIVFRGYTKEEIEENKKEREEKKNTTAPDSEKSQKNETAAIHNDGPQGEASSEKPKDAAVDVGQTNKPSDSTHQQANGPTKPATHTESPPVATTASAAAPTINTPQSTRPISQGALPHSVNTSERSSPPPAPNATTIHEMPMSTSPSPATYAGSQRAANSQRQTPKESQKKRSSGVPGKANNAVNKARKTLKAVQNIKIPNPIGGNFYKRVFIGFFASFFGTFLILSLLGVLDISSVTGGGDNGGSTNQNGQTGPKIPFSPGACPSTAGNFEPASCKYLNPAIDLFESNIPQDSLNAYIDKYSPVFVDGGKGTKEDFISRVNYIVSAANEANLNPALFLGYWKSETLFGTKGTAEMGCIDESINSFEDQVDCAMGLNKYSSFRQAPIPLCARSRDANSDACKYIKAIRENAGYDALNPISYPIATFDDFAEAHGPFGHDPTPEKRKGNCTATYNVLMEVIGELNVCAGGIPPPSSTPQVATSCPIPNGVITCGSQNTPVIGGPLGDCGHCGVGYDAPCDFEGTKSAMDIDTNDAGGQEVVMPLIDGHVIDWTLNHIEPKGGRESLYGYAGTDTENGDKYYLQYSHVGTGTGTVGKTYKSGDIGAKTCLPTSPGADCHHLHVQLIKGASSLGPVTWADAMQFFCRSAPAI